MPNGTPDFREVAEPEYEQFFEPISKELHDFAARHGLKLEKYYHEAPVWSFLFRHPYGGVAKIDVSKESDDSIKLWYHWWQDDYARGIRFLRQTQSACFPRQAGTIAPRLESALRDILSWPAGSWTDEKGGFADIWQRTWSRDAFYQMELVYPIAKA
jgi:hypothetical protein